MRLLEKKREIEIERDQGSMPMKDQLLMRIAELETAIQPFAEAADVYEREYPGIMPQTGCNVRFDALCSLRQALRATPSPSVRGMGNE